MTEQQLHGACAQFLSWALADPETFWTTFPAGGGGYDRGKILRRLGLKAGVPDILLVRKSRLYGIELKTDTGRVSAAQVECHAAMRLAGVMIEVVRSLEELESALLCWGIPMRTSKPASPLMNSFAKALQNIG